MNMYVEHLVNATNDTLKKSAAAAARSYLPSIADPESRLMWEASILTAEKDYDRAGVVLSKVKHFDRGTFTSLKLAAKTSATLLRNDGAIELCTLALKMKKSEEMLTMRAGAYMCEKRLIEASRDYAEAATIAYPSANYCRAAACLYKNNEPAKAQIYVEKSFQGAHFDDLPNCYFCRGMCQQLLNHPKEAVAAFTNALDSYAKQLKRSSILPNHTYNLFVSNCLNERSKCYDRLGMTAEAASDRGRKGALAREVELEFFGK